LHPAFTFVFGSTVVAPSHPPMAARVRVRV
jgi:hypothetical protein